MDPPPPVDGVGDEQRPATRPRGWRTAAAVVGIAAGALVLPALATVLVTSWVLGSLGSSDAGSGPEGCRQSEVDLIRLASFGHVEEVRAELDGGTDPNVPDDAGNSPLACAGPEGNVEVVELLLDAGADVDTIARDEDSVVQDAAIHCQPAVLAVLLDRGPHRDELDPALARAARRADVRSVRLLLEHGADPDAFDDPGGLFEEHGESCTDPSPEERAFVLDLVLSAGADPDAVLGAAVAHDQPALAADALELGADPDARVASEVAALLGTPTAPSSPLVVAATGGSSQMVRLLLAAGADPDLPAAAPIETTVCADDPTDCSAVAALVALTPPEESPEGSEHGALVRSVTTTPLLEAAWNGDGEVVDALLAAGADPNGPGELGFTPLHAAAAAGDQEIVAALFTAGATPAAAGTTRPSDLAELAGHGDLGAFLRATGA